ncbi:MAG TPA: ABC transporter ATP-binding protein [Candidatus Acidoferrales bacterium]|nr:ABC transporter ATP-binding protein [Candidatus Acidoferrales bacterium]
MSVAKPVLDWIAKMKVKRNILSSGKEFRTFMKYNKPYIKHYIGMTVLSGVRAALFALEPLYLALIIDKVIIGGQRALLPGLVLSTILAVMGVGLLTFGESFMNSYVAEWQTRDIRSDYFKSLEEKSFEFYDSNAVGDLVSRATMDLQAVNNFAGNWPTSVTDSIFVVAACLLIMVPINPLLTLLTLAPMPLIMYLQFRQFTQVRPLFMKMMLILGKLGAYIQQNIIGMKNVRIFEKEKEMKDGFKQVESKYVETAISAGRVQAFYTASPQTILQIGMAFVYVYGTSLLFGPNPILLVGNLILFATYMQRIVPQLNSFANVIGSWVNASASLERIEEMDDAPIDVRDSPNARDIVIEGGKVEFNNVNFGYTSGTNVLTDISFKAEAGEKIAILGSTGSGKTSLINLIPRFYDVNSGTIKIDGVDIKEYKLASLQKQIGLVLQDVLLFTGTIRSNISLGKPDATIEEIINAAKLAKIHDFVVSLPDKYDSLVGERGVTLSGGQKQRITIARAILTNPKILILDDSLSFVDARTEQEIQQALEEAMKGRTTFIIAQRLSTIKNADKILVLEEGRVAEFGTHIELMTKAGIYKRVYETQFLEKTPSACGQEVP